MLLNSILDSKFKPKSNSESELKIANIFYGKLIYKYFTRPYDYKINKFGMNKF